MNKKTLYEKWKREEEKTFCGWDFSNISGYCSTETPWDYRSIVKSFLKNKMNLLDMGTGGGEFLLTLSHPYEKTWVTESYMPNISLIKKNLIPLGIHLCEVDKDSDLDLSDNFFDIVTNRHESYDLGEIRRILKRDCLFITNQVGGDNNIMLSSRLIDGYKPKYPNHNLNNEKTKFISEGFEIIYSNEAIMPSMFYDVATIVRYAKIIEWEFPNFSVDKCLDRLYELHDEICEKGYVASNESRFIIVAVNRKELKSNDKR